MHQIDRRTLLVGASAGAAISTSIYQPVFAQTTTSTIENWMDEASSKAPRGALLLMRFVEPIYVLREDIHWVPGPSDKGRLSKVDVPKGFVTDLASVPQAFWSLLRPDGEYTYAAILHDWMYWIQDRPRGHADEIFFASMKEFGIDAVTANTIYAAVEVAGKSAWSGNAELKLKGEKRVLKKFPEDPLMHWSEWKTRSDVFL